jgi:2,4'-dihydroxyacetophenone dioxygenase
MSDAGHQNVSDPAAYSGIAADLARVVAAGDGGLQRFHEVLVETEEIGWSPKSLPGLSQRMLWRDDDTGGSIALVKFEVGAGVPSIHSHASNQFMYCLAGRYAYTTTGVVLRPGSFYWNPKGCLHGPTLAEEESILLEIYDGPHYPTQPDWYTDPEDAR